MSQPIAPGGRSLPLSPQDVNLAKVDPTVLKAAQEFEALFIDFMTQAMRKTIPETSLSFNSGPTKIYQDMLDSEYAQMASRQGNVGLAQQIIAYWETAGYNVRRRETPPRAVHRKAEREDDRGPLERTGGTYEGRERDKQSTTINADETDRSRPARD